jgi:xanthine/uracil permease
MSPVPTDRAPEQRLRRNLWVWGLVTIGGGLAGGLLFSWFGEDRAGAGGPTYAHALVIVAWVALASCFIWMRWRPRKAYDRAAVRARTEAFQAKRWVWLVAMSVFISLLLTPLAVWHAMRPDPADTLIDRLFEATLFLGPCALTLGMMTTTIYSREWGAVVDDELTAAHRASAFAAGFVTLLVAGVAAYITSLLRPNWGLAVLPPVVAAPLVVAALRFALLERAAAQADG